MNNLPKHHGVGLPDARGLMQLHRLHRLKAGPDCRRILQTWKLKLSITKTGSAAFHLNNQEATRELKIKYNNATLPFYSEPKYLGATLDRSFTYRRHLESLRKKLTSCVALLRWLAASSWSAGASTLWTASLALVRIPWNFCQIWMSSPPAQT